MFWALLILLVFVTRANRHGVADGHQFADAIGRVRRVGAAADRAAILKNLKERKNIVSDTNVVQFPQFKSQPITPDFVMSQLRLALVAVLAYGGGKGWFTPADATLITALSASLIPLMIPWLWSIASNLGTVRVNNGSAAAVVAQVEAVDQQSAKVGATNALIANSDNPATPNIKAAA